MSDMKGQLTWRGIAIGIVIVWAIVQTWQNIQGDRQRKSAPEDAPSEALQSDELA